MLKKKFRLKKKDLKALNFYKTHGRSQFFIVKRLSSGLSFSRFAAIVGAGVSKSAARRNKIRRAIFDFIRLNNLYLIPNKDTLVIVLPRAAQLKKMETEKELRSLLF